MRLKAVHKKYLVFLHCVGFTVYPDIRLPLYTESKFHAVMKQRHIILPDNIALYLTLIKIQVVFLICRFFVPKTQYNNITALKSIFSVTCILSFA